MPLRIESIPLVGSHSLPWYKAASYPVFFVFRTAHSRLVDRMYFVAKMHASPILVGLLIRVCGRMVVVHAGNICT